MFAIDLVRLPARIDGMEPGPELASTLASIDLGALSGHDRVLMLRAWQRMASYCQAHASAAMAAVHDAISVEDDDPEFGFKAAAAEIRAALRLTRRYADSQLDLALDLQRRLPRVWQAWAAGDLDVRKARDFVEGTAHLDDGLARDVVDRVIEEAPGLTTGQLRARLRALCIDADPDDAARRYDDAVAERRVVAAATVEGTANLMGLDLPPERVAAATRRVNDLAKSLKLAGETRTMDQLRADVYLDLLEGNDVGTDSRSKGTVDIRVDLETLARLADHPGDVGGYGPVIADIARQVTEEQQGAEWRFAVTHPDSGQPLHAATTKRRPSAHQQRQVQARYPTCVFPGCRMPSTECDLDHRVPWSDSGRTCAGCLTPACRHDHTIRHRAGWSYQRLADGDHLWTSRLGHTYTTSGRPP